MFLIKKNILNMPMPLNISYLWNFGSLLGICLMFQIITGFMLSMHFSTSMELTFNSIDHIMRNVNYGFLFRILHANGASFFFLFIYIHIGRNIYNGSYMLMKVWFSGIFLILILMMTAFIGYVLPWGQMSFWGASVITNLLTAIPYIGKMITYWIWGGFSVDSPTLNRFFSLHFIMPFLMIILIMIHIFFLHEKGSNNPLGLNSNLNKINFNPFFLIKDMYGFFLFFMIIMLFSLLKPYNLMDCDNFIKANPLVTPPHIQPEWYFLFAYAILRSIPNKLGGVLALFLSILINLILSYKNYLFLNFSNNFMMKLLYFFFIFNFILLTFLGSCPVEDPFILLAQILSFLYFLFYLMI